MKFLRLLLSAIHRPPICPTIKNFYWHCPCPTSDVPPGANTVGKSYTMCIGPRSVVGCRIGAMSREVVYGWSVRRSEGSRTAKGIVGRRTVDGRKFLLLFRTALKILDNNIFQYLICHYCGTVCRVPSTRDTNIFVKHNTPPQVNLKI